MLHRISIVGARNVDAAEEKRVEVLSTDSRPSRATTDARSTHTKGPFSGTCGSGKLTESPHPRLCPKCCKPIRLGSRGAELPQSAIQSDHVTGLHAGEDGRWELLERELPREVPCQEPSQDVCDWVEIHVSFAR